MKILKRRRKQRAEDRLCNESATQQQFDKDSRGIHERREATTRPTGFSGKVMVHPEEKALQQGGHAWEEGDKDICSQPGRQNSSQRPVCNWTPLGLRVMGVTQAATMRKCANWA